jgi:hypothetical protein
MWFGRWSWSGSEFELLVTNPELLDKVLAKQLAIPSNNCHCSPPNSLDSVGGDIIQIRSLKTNLSHKY